MAKIKTVYSCQECGFQTPKWLGKCPDCQQWNSFSEEEQIKPSKAAPKSISGRESHPKTIDEVEHEKLDRYQTTIG
jgi:DNA repair protein RadA/Sms